MITIEESEVIATVPGSLTSEDASLAVSHGTLQFLQDRVGAAVDGRMASFPGQKAAPDPSFPNTDALPLIGRDRRLPKGSLEDDVSYARRLRYWRRAHKYAGTYMGMLCALRAVLLPTPPKIHVVRSGFEFPPLPSTVDWWTIDDTGVRHLCTKKDGSHPGVFWPLVDTELGPDFEDVRPIPDKTAPLDWNWDGHYWRFGLNEDKTRLWVIIQAPCLAPQLSGKEGTWGDGQSVYGEETASGDKLTIGTTATESFVTLARSTLQQFKSPGCYVEKIIIPFTADLFDPVTGLSTSQPDGWFRYHGKPVNVGGGVYQRQIARSNRALYWRGTEAHRYP